MNKKGLMGQILIILIMVIVLICVIAFYYAWSLVAPFVTEFGQEALDLGIIATQNDTPSNLSNSATTSFGALRDSLGLLETLSILFFFFLIIGFIAIASFVRTYPFLIVVWIIAIIVLSLIGIFFSAEYDNIKQQDATAREVYASWGMNDFILSNLPIIIILVGTLGALVMLFVLATDSDIQTSQGGIEL